MNLDKEIRDQEAFDEASFSKEDTQLYTLLFNELDKETPLNINPEFAPDVLARLDAKKRRESRWENFLFGSAIVGVLLLTLLGLSFVKQAMQQSDGGLGLPVITPEVLFAGLIIIFQVVDKRYIKDKLLKDRLPQ